VRGRTRQGTKSLKRLPGPGTGLDEARVAAGNVPENDLRSTMMLVAIEPDRMLALVTDEVARKTGITK
jgi:hypothetical protein